jgi:hypothetical protein
MSNEEDQVKPQQEEPFALFVKAMNSAMEQVSLWMQQAATVIMPALKQLSDALTEKYQEAGSPYGETQEGLLQWMKDMGEINHKKQEIERILQHHEMLIDARAFGERLRAKYKAQEEENEQ